MKEQTTSSGPLIEMAGVSVGALRDQSTLMAEGVNWTVSGGDYWVIAGLQGSGKSDFLMMTAGLMAPAAGNYTLFGEQMPIFDEARLPIRQRIGLVFDGGQLFNHLTVSENVALPLRYHRNLSAWQANERVQQWLEALELGPWADSTPGALGRNWQKRVGLARALVLEPEVLLIDNPLGGVDFRHINWWLGFLDVLGRGHPLLGGKPVTLVASTADLRRWRGRARQFAILRDRQFVVLGTWQQVESASDELLHELLMTEAVKE
ncbi:MAG TPA: ATP-binding cassette domain-containing protein [Candidatus Dormibacteraeota bacterium]|nr:ATP-binding cassette domain-containing protein [Candidatus Dormibacteraeota bacterium]